MKKIIFLLLLTPVLVLGVELNLGHFKSLVDTVVLEDDTLAYVRIYAEYPSYGPVGAENEGIACVDDVARGIVLLCEMYRADPKEETLGLILYMSRFIKFMQREDGAFYNFVHGDMKINRKGKTSRPEFGFWAARALWALGECRRTLPDSCIPAIDSIWNKSCPRIEDLLDSYPETEMIGGKEYPRWLLYGYAADASSELLLGLNARYQAVPDETTARYMEKLVEGIFMMSDTTSEGDRYFLCWPDSIWHAWGCGQIQAVTEAALLLNRQDWLERIVRDYVPFYQRWVARLFPAYYHRVQEKWIYFPQIAYNIRPAAKAFALLKDRMNDSDKWTAAVLSWLLGNNPGRDLLYYEKSGIVYDGINNVGSVNRNSGAESTIEALLALTTLLENPSIAAYLPVTLIWRDDVEFVCRFGNGTIMKTGIMEKQFEPFSPVNTLLQGESDD